MSVDKSESIITTEAPPARQNAKPRRYPPTTTARVVVIATLVTLAVAALAVIVTGAPRATTSTTNLPPIVAPPPTLNTPQPDELLQFTLAASDCSPDDQCGTARIDGQSFTLDLGEPKIVDAVSLRPDQLLPNRIVTRARWQFDHSPMTVTQDLTAFDTRGWSVVQTLHTGVRASTITVTVLDSAVPTTGKGPGPGTASAFQIRVR